MSWQDLISEAMRMQVYGFSLAEKVLKLRLGMSPGTITLADGTVMPLAPSKYNDGTWGWNKFAFRAQNTRSRWDIDQHGDIHGMWQADPFRVSTEVYLPMAKCLLFRTSTHKNNPEGFSMLRRAYRPWYMKKRIEEGEAIGVDRDIGGMPVLELPMQLMKEDASDAEKALRARMTELVQQIRNDEQGGITIPAELEDGVESGFRLRLMSTGGSRQFDTNVIVRRYAQEILTSVLCPFLVLGQDKTSSSYSMVSSSTSTFVMALGATLEMIFDVFNRCAVHPLMMLNNVPPEEWPVVKYGDIETPNLKELADFLSPLLAQGAVTPNPEMENRLLEFAGLPPRPEGAPMPTPKPAAPPAPAPGAVPSVDEANALAKHGPLDRLPGVVERLAKLRKQAQVDGDTVLQDEMTTAIQSLLQRL